ncbi:cystatin-A-like [Carettochelys insculpta]|uniref:cystatin-A-like n=1 Tax=Carettochelys insculpta TaxID=44489 RepID=UPI003EC097BA
MVPGGFSDVEPATPEVQAIADHVKPQLEKKENTTYKVFEALQYRTQVVAGGINYLIKVCISETEDRCVHLRMYKALRPEPQEPSLTAYQLDKTKTDPLVPF